MAFFLERLIASRMGKGKSAFSRPIVNIAIVSIALGVAVMILALFIVQGFQDQIRNKVIDFGGHLQVTASSGSNKETERIEINPQFIDTVLAVPGINKVEVFATKPVILETTESIQALVVKGVQLDSATSFLSKKLIRGSINSLAQNDLIISDFTARKMRVDTNQRVTLYFVLDADDIKPRVFNVAGIYDTGLEEFDQQFAFLDLSHLQKINNWGLQAQWRLADSCKFGATWIEPLAFGGDGNHRFGHDTDQRRGGGEHRVCLKSDTSFRVIAYDRSQTIPDTAWIHFDVDEQQVRQDSCACSFDYSVTTSGGSAQYYAGGYEILIDEFDDLFALSDSVFNRKPLLYNVSNISDRHREIFSWLEMLDINVIIIIILMIVVSVINMVSAMIIIIIERTSMIGLLKAFGIDNRRVIGIFMLHSVRIITWGILLGNLVGVGIALLQEKFKFLTLDATNYYMSYVPVEVRWDQVFILDAITLVVCVICLLFPALLASWVKPVKAIQFD